jgi:DNA-binding LacI/PurR family transcriptional regulator
MALGVYNAALKHGKKIPQDFALAGGDGVDFFSEEYIPLTTFKVDCKGLGKRSINNLLGIIDGRISKPFQESIDSSLLIRKTA